MRNKLLRFLKRYSTVIGVCMILIGMLLLQLAWLDVLRM